MSNSTDRSYGFQEKKENEGGIKKWAVVAEPAHEIQGERGDRGKT